MLFCERGIRAPESLYSLNKFYVIPSEAEKKWNLMGVYVPIFFLFISHAKAGMSAETLNQTATLLCEALFKKKYKRSFFFFKKLIEDPFEDCWDEVIAIAFSAIWLQAKCGDFMEKGYSMSWHLGRQFEYMSVLNFRPNFLRSRLEVNEKLTRIYQSECKKEKEISALAWRLSRMPASEREKLLQRRGQ